MVLTKNTIQLCNLVDMIKTYLRISTVESQRFIKRRTIFMVKQNGAYFYLKFKFMVKKFSKTFIVLKSSSIRHFHTCMLLKMNGIRSHKYSQTEPFSQLGYFQMLVIIESFGTYLAIKLKLRRHLLTLI